MPSLPEADAVLVSGYLPSPVLEAVLADARAEWVMLDAAALVKKGLHAGKLVGHLWTRLDNPAKVHHGQLVQRDRR